MRRFIYLDTDTLNSYIAQIYDGLIQSQETETQTETGETKHNEFTPAANASADIKVFGEGLEGKLNIAYKRLKETSNTNLISDVQTKLLHDNAFDQLMEYLIDKGLLDSSNIGSFTLINDSFYILDLDYYQKLFNNKELMELVKQNEKSTLIAQLDAEQEQLLAMPNADEKEISDNYKKKKFEIKSHVASSYNEILKMVDMLVAIVPYKKTLCIGNNLVVLNGTYMRDDINMASFKYGGKIKVLGYITNKIGDASLTENLPEFAQFGASMNDVMLTFFTKDTSLNIVHPIAIYYE